MHSKHGTTWKGIILRRREKIKELTIGVEMSKAYASGKNLEQYQKENEKSKQAVSVLETSLSHLRRRTQNTTKRTRKALKAKRQKSRVIYIIVILNFHYVCICMSR